MATGHPACFYPDVPPGDAALLCAGMYDALMARQHELPATTTTCGTVLPGHLAYELTGRRVCVCTDVGEEKDAERVVQQLRVRRERQVYTPGYGYISQWEGAAEAWRVELDGPEGYDLSDWFREGRTREELIQRIKDARHHAR